MRVVLGGALALWALWLLLSGGPLVWLLPLPIGLPVYALALAIALWVYALAVKARREP